MADLKTFLAAEGIDVSDLKTLREVAVEGDDDLADEPETELEQQFPVYVLPTDPHQTLSVWEKLRALTEKIGHYPVILGNKDNVGRHWGHREWAENPEAGLAVAMGYRVKEWFDKEWQDMFKPGYAIPQLKEEDFHGEWPEKAIPTTRHTVPHQYLDPPVTQYIGFLETTASWKVPVCLSFGGWNDCQRPELQAAIHRYWQEKYQTEIVEILFDWLVCRVGKPVTTQEAALELAREHRVYCSDNFNFGETLEFYGAHLINSTYWSFWWD
jgi:hypothetical protein